MKETVRYTGLAEALERLGGAEDPSEYHGTLCGTLCVQEPAELDPLRLLDADTRDERRDRNAEALLHQLRQETFAALASHQMDFAPLLPADDLPLGPRVQALALWCQGFLFGLASYERIDFKSCTEEAQEIIRDFSHFTQAGFEAGDDEELEESAYAELVEYVRVGAQLLFIELSPGSRRNSDDADDDAKPTLH